MNGTALPPPLLRRGLSPADGGKRPDSVNGFGVSADDLHATWAAVSGPPVFGVWSGSPDNLPATQRALQPATSRTCRVVAGRLSGYVLLCFATSRLLTRACLEKREKGKRKKSRWEVAQREVRMQTGGGPARCAHSSVAPASGWHLPGEAR